MCRLCASHWRRQADRWHLFIAGFFESSFTANLSSLSNYIIMNNYLCRLRVLFYYCCHYYIIYLFIDLFLFIYWFYFIYLFSFSLPERPDCAETLARVLHKSITSQSTLICTWVSSSIDGKLQAIRLRASISSLSLHPQVCDVILCIFLCFF